MAFLSQASHLGSLLLPHDAFQEYATHPAEWSAELNSKGSERTCIRSGLATFLHCAFTVSPGLVVDRWASNGENGSHRHFLFRQDVWTMFRHQISKEITSIISTPWHFTTKSGGIWNFVSDTRWAICAMWGRSNWCVQNPVNDRTVAASISPVMMSKRQHVRSCSGIVCAGQ